MWITGFDRLMPEGRPFPRNYLPRLGTHLTVTFGDPVPAEQIQQALSAVDRRQLPCSTISPLDGRGDAESQRTLEMLKIRAEITSIIQRSVVSLGRSVSGDNLS